MSLAAARGRDFEAEVAGFLRTAGFEVTPNSKVATPRQTDLFARCQDINVLVEVKHRKRKVDVSDIDSLRARLHRTTSDVVGAIFSSSGLTKGAIKEIELDRTREILVFTQQEIDQLYSHSINLRTLFDRKRDELRIHGRAWFGSAIHKEFLSVQLPMGSSEFRLGEETLSYFASRSSFAAAFLVLELPDPGWGSRGGEGARLSVRLALDTVEDLRNIFGYLHQKFGLSNSGMFSIHQAHECWHGAGAEHFLRELERPNIRYARSGSKEFHHSEECHYFDQFRNGWIEVSCERDVDFELRKGRSRSRLRRSELVIQLPGVPVDLSPFVQLCRYTGNDWANFEYIGDRGTFGRRLKEPVPLRVVGIVLDKNASHGEMPDTNVSGIIARNPFYKKALPKELSDDSLPTLIGLTETELLMCSLGHWHQAGQKVSGYKLVRIEATISGVGVVVRAIGDWDRIVTKLVKSKRLFVRSSASIHLPGVGLWDCCKSDPTLGWISRRRNPSYLLDASCS